MTVKVLEKDIIKTDGFIMIDQNICIELTEKRAFLTFKGENIGEFTKKQAGKMKVSLKPKRIKNRFKNRFVMKPIINESGEIIHHYRADFSARDFRASIWATLARIENYKNKNNARKIN